MLLEKNCVIDGIHQRQFTASAAAGLIESGPMIHADPDDRQPECNIHSGNSIPGSLS